MAKQQIKKVRDLRVILKDMEPFIKNPDFLRTGRNISNFSLRPREVLANWLLCVVGNYNNRNNDLTFAEDPTGGDGVILNSRTGEFMLTEHVFIPPPRLDDKNTVEELMIDKIMHKVRRGAVYARGKHLVVFSEAIGIWYPNRIGRRIEGLHVFASVWAVGLERCDKNGYIYWVTQFSGPYRNSAAWKVEINFKFTEYSVCRVQ